MACRCNSARSAFTLIEALVVIGILGVLIALLVPALRGVRASARATACLSNLRGVGASVQAYLGSYQERYPFALATSALRTSPPGDMGSSSIQTGNHWNLDVYWGSLFHDVAPWREHFATWVCPGAPGVPGAMWLAAPDGTRSQGVPSYRYAHGFIARPEVWSGAGRADPAMLRPVTASDVHHPAQKVVLFDGELAHLAPGEIERDRRPMLFADGHSALRRVSECAGPVVNPFTGLAERLHDTPDGARGRDY